MRKNIETILATRLSWPSIITPRANAQVSRTARRGLLVVPEPLAKGMSSGKILSAERDCRMRGPPRKEAMAEERVAAMTPASIKKS